MGRKVSLLLRDILIRNKSMNATRIVAGSFAAIILFGALLLTLPFASRDGQSAGFFTSLFTATSATCVTGLVVVDTWIQWSAFGQVVILAMIQLGGLGFMTIITLFSFLLHRRIGLSERLIMVSTLNLNDLDGVVRMVRLALIGTCVLETTGAVILTTRFIPDFGILGGIWRGIFHSISAFCNAGFDLVGGKYGALSSMIGYNDDPFVLGTIMSLIAVGGLGFFVWADVLRKKSWKKLTFYSKMVLAITGALILFGAVAILFTEFNNPATLGNMPLWQKVLNAVFQSITLRTAGFDSIGQGGLRESSQALCIILMLIGGSSGSTAGGIKTVTVGVLLLALRAGILGREQVSMRGHAISYQRVLNAMTLALMVVALFLVGSVAISAVDGLPYLSVAFETASAMGTVGLTTGITPGLSPFARIVIIILMYLGRVGVLSFSIAFISRAKAPAKLKFPEYDIMIG